ncbi:MAG TPA: hypothetical protein VFV85_03580 [Conexibacter sp.]|nr:hypothetical protein [Conexibacter sp.]
MSGLSAGTTYHYRLVSTNAAGTTNGADQTFTTAAANTPPPPPRVAPKLKLAATSGAVRGGKVVVKLSCPSGASSSCSGKLQMTMKEKVVVKVKGKRKTKTKTVTVGKANVSIAAGQTKSISVKLSGAAKKALKTHSRLKVSLTAPGVKHAFTLKAPARPRRHKK